MPTDSNSGALTSSVYIYNIITHGIHNLVEEKRGQIGIEKKKKRKSSKKNFNCWLFTLFVLQYQAPIEGGLIGGVFYDPINSVCLRMRAR